MTYAGRSRFQDALAILYKIASEADIYKDSLTYQQMLEQIIIAKDSLYKYNSAQAIAELQTRNTFLQKINVLHHCKLLFIAKNGNECLEELKGLPFKALPRIIFMDIEMPELDGIQTISLAKSLYPQIHFIVLTVFDDDEKIFDAIKAGVSGYLLKHESAAVPEDAIVNVLKYQGAPMSPAIARKALQLLSRSGNSAETKAEADLPTVITEREKEILQQMVNGWDAKRIASALNLSVLTVRKHIANIYEKLHVNSRAQVISLAHKNNWV